MDWKVLAECLLSCACVKQIRLATFTFTRREVSGVYLKVNGPKREN
jgi:hypothetical protein